MIRLVMLHKKWKLDYVLAKEFHPCLRLRGPGIF